MKIPASTFLPQASSPHGRKQYSISRLSFVPRVAALLIAFVPIPGLSAATYLVDQAKGNDTNSGTESSPLLSVQAGVDKLKPGDTLLIGNGIYRETVNVKPMGTKAAPILIKAAPGAKPVLSGAERITDWKACASEEETGGNPDFGKIYYADISWIPTALFEDKKKQEISQMPDGGWWPAMQMASDGVIDPDRLKGKNLIPDGATLFFFKYKGHGFIREKITSFDSETGTLHVGRDLGPKFTPGGDRYRLENHARYISRPGEWSFVEKEGGARIYYMPYAANINDAMIEIPQRKNIILLGHTAYCTVEGLELTMTIFPGKVPEAAIGGERSKTIEGAGESITIAFCKIHHNGRFGIIATGYKNMVIKNNLISRNLYGVILSGQTDTLFENNEVGDNFTDGLIISHGSKGIVVRNNYIHHHCMFGHPDNVQFYRDVKDVLLEGNFLLASGQGVMMEEVEGVTFRNNVIAATEANMIICGHGNTNNGRFENNTMALWNVGVFSFTGQNYQLKGNMFVNAGGKIVYGVPQKGAFSSEANLFFRMPDVKASTLITKDKFRSADLQSIQEKTGLEAGSVIENPELKNVPSAIYSLDAKKVGDCTASKLFYDTEGANEIAVGDLVEVHFDGIPRKVTAAEPGAITIEPPLPDIPDRVLFVCNWKTNTNFVLDFTSPRNDQFGSKINTVNYQKGDFDGDGKRDIPER